MSRSPIYFEQINHCTDWNLNGLQGNKDFTFHKATEITPALAFIHILLIGMLFVTYAIRVCSYTKTYTMSTYTSNKLSWQDEKMIA